jgi:hypothetical protein
MLYAIAVIAVQVMTLVHVVRTERTQPWLWVVLFFPLIGSIVYLVAEVLPDMLGQGAGRRAMNAAQNRLDPERHLRALKEQAETIDTPQAHADYARELTRLGRFAEAIAIYERIMSGLFADDPELAYSASLAAFEGAERGALPWRQARTTLERLETADPKFRTKDRALFRARLAAAEGDAAKAQEEFIALNKGYSSPEVRVRYAHFLYTQGCLDDAHALLSSVVTEAKRATPHVRQMNVDWFQQAETALNVVDDARAKS